MASKAEPAAGSRSRRTEEPDAPSPVFGVSLCTLGKRERAEGVAAGARPPALVTALVARLEALGANKRSDLFAVEAAAEQVDSARARINDGQDPVVVAGGCDANVCAGLLRRWLRELPSNLIDCDPVSLNSIVELTQRAVAGEAVSSEQVPSA